VGVGVRDEVGEMVMVGLIEVEVVKDRLDLVIKHIRPKAITNRTNHDPDHSSRMTRRRSWRDGWKASRLAVQRGNRDWLGLLCLGVTSDRSGEEHSMMGSELFLVIIILLYACPIRSFQSRVLYEISPHNRRHRHD